MTHVDDRPFDQWSDAEKLADVQAELTRVQRMYERAVSGRWQWERDVRTAARAAAEGDRLAWAEHSRAHLLDRMTPWLREITYRIEQLPDRPKQADLDALRQVAGTVTHALATYRADLAEKPDPVLTQRNEVQRLRAYILARGRALHASAPSTGERCACQGCDLIRGMDHIDQTAGEPVSA